jgi:two-component SAPR family response regulator
MKSAEKIVISLLIALFLTSSVEANQVKDGLERGLYFHAFQVNKDNRTTLNLTPNKPISLSGGFTLAFNFQIRAETEIFGYILRVIGNDTTNIDLISNSYLYNNIILVAGNHTLMDFNLDELPENPVGKWSEAILTLDTKLGKLEFTLCGIRKSVEYDIGKLKRFHICFGGNSHANFTTTDVAPFILRDVKIFDGKKRLFRYWRLGKHGDGGVFDECEGARATVTNAKWEIDYHTEWERLTSVTVRGRYPKIAFDRKSKRFFIVRNNVMYLYDTGRNVIDTLTFKQGIPFNVELNQLFYDETTGELMMYDFEKNHLGRFNFASQKWDNNDNHLTFSRYRHHNKYYDEANKTIYTLGGYGFHQYSALLQFYSDTLHRWESADLSDLIHPRYLASMGVWNDSLLLYFGGYGNASGKQYEAPHNHYDLYALNPRTRNIRKLWELDNIDRHFTNSNSLIVNLESQAFLTLSYPNNVYETEASLHEYSLHSPGYRKLANPIPFLFNDEESWCDLFMPADSSALFAVLSYTEESDSRIEIYSIAYPPLSMSDTLQTESRTTVLRTLFPYLVVSIALLALLLGGAVRRQKKTRRIHPPLKTATPQTGTEQPTGNETNRDSTTAYPAINVLNGFEVLDSTGTDITHLFTPTSAQLFLLIYFKAVHDRKGITSHELQKTLWPDKDYESAQNSRNVYFNKLRTILNMMGDVRLNKTNESWTLAYDNEKMHNDYEQLVRNVNLLREKPGSDKNLLHETLRIARKGKLLPFHEMEWLDSYKASYASMIIDFLWNLAEHPDIRNDYPLLLDMAEVILIQDSLEESGIRLKCRSFFKLGKKKQALLCYNKYAEEYFTMLNIRTELSFDEIVK